ncbi:MAG: glycoside hydrolase family 127 protein [Bacteroidales bacterium]|nr:glycoside hydrolase family 127 protein [Bacteroidales bacterium]
MLKFKFETFLWLPFIILAGCTTTVPETGTSAYPIQPVPFTSVKVTDNFWAPRIKTNHDVTIPIAIEQSTITGRIKNFEIAAGMAEGEFCSIYPFDDSDVFKIIEGASYSLQTFPDPGLEAKLDTLIAKIGAAQEEDGYLYTYRTIMGDDSHPWVGKRWEKTHLLSHELYNLGHMYEAAVAHFQATGKRSFLDIALKSADLVNEEMGWGKIETYPGHQEIEIGLVKLYLVTGEQKYLDLAKFFLDVRGPGGEEYSQSHLKVVDQREAVGHSVRAAYMYTGMADVAALTGDEAYVNAISHIWEDIVHRKMYVSGGIGASGGNEGFGEPYHLPNMSAYCETCASIANVFWNHRMFLHHGEAKYYDVLERTLYNALLSGVSLSGDRFFYPNVLESAGQHQRQAWFGCACCPSNISRFIPSVPGYVYARTPGAVYINMYLDNTASIGMDNQSITIIQETMYPWDGEVRIRVKPEKEGKFDLMLRIPGWARGEALPGGLYSFVNEENEDIILQVNGKDQKIKMLDGYAVISKKWKAGDMIKLVLPMKVQEVIADERVEADSHRFALQRGPLVYCAEWPDNKDGKVLNLVFDPDARIEYHHLTDTLKGTDMLSTSARQARRTLDGEIVLGDVIEARLIPYHLWNNRGPGEMKVWLPDTATAARPDTAPTIASRSTLSASKLTRALGTINDQYEPRHSNDREWSYYHWWPDTASWEWVQYDFEKSQTISEVRVYWFDDRPDGGCRVPDDWELQYLQNGKWLPVRNRNDYTVSKDDWDVLHFDPVTASALRLRVKLNENFSGGIHEWIVE